MNYGFVDIYRDIPVDAVLEANSARKGKGKIPLDRLVDMLKVEFDVKGSATVAEISAMTGMHTGDTWAVSDSGTLPSGLALTAGDLVMWAGDTWSRIFHLDLTGYATVEQLNAAVAALTAAINDAVATEKAQREAADATEKSQRESADAALQAEINHRNLDVEFDSDELVFTKGRTVVNG